MGLPRTCKAHDTAGKQVKKRFTKFSAKELELAKEWFKNDVRGVFHLFAQGYPRRFEAGCRAYEWVES